MNSDTHHAIQQLIHDFREWLKEKRFEGVTGAGEDGVGVRVYIDVKKMDSTTRETIEARAHGIRLTFVEHVGPIRQT